MGNALKTIRYFKRNGFVSTGYAILERLLPQRGVPFDEKEAVVPAGIYPDNDIKFSILVPVYETKTEYLRAMIESCLMQTYGNLELIIADASKSDRPGKVVSSYEDVRIRYIKLPENKGISANTNPAIKEATGDYCVLLDHDDLLSLSALSINAGVIAKARKEGIEPALLYSDEDKCDGSAHKFFMPHIKEKFNLDLLLSNNYICHLAVIRRDIMQELLERPEFDGSQDHDLFLRIAGTVLYGPEGRYDESKEREIIHVPSILYHWRSYELSTASDPASKEYAYTAGLKAVESFGKEHFGDCSAYHLEHRGFYGLKYEGNIFEQRPELGAIGGMALRGGRVVTGLLSEDGTDPYKGMLKGFSGYMRKAKLSQTVYALDIRKVTPAPDLKSVYDKIFADYESASLGSNKKNRDLMAVKYGMDFGTECKRLGRKVLYLPEQNGEV